MKIILTDHARKRMLERSISIKHIREAILLPTVKKPSYVPTEMIQKITQNGTLEIIFKKRNQTYIIITLYYL